MGLMDKMWEAKSLKMVLAVTGSTEAERWAAHDVMHAIHDLRNEINDLPKVLQPFANLYCYIAHSLK